MFFFDKNEIIFFISLIFVVPTFAGKNMVLDNMLKNISTQVDLENLFLKDASQIISEGQSAILDSKKDLEKLYNIEDSKRTFENTANFFDLTVNKFNISLTLMRIIEFVHTDSDLRNLANESALKLNAFAIDHFWQNRKLYDLFKNYAENNALQENLSTVQKYFIKEQLESFERSGLHLPENEQTKLRNLQKELAKHVFEFEKNIASDLRFIEVEVDELKGLSEDFIGSLRKSESGKYILGTDYPTYFYVMQNCEVENTRFKLWKEFVNRAYPQNTYELEKIIALRDQLAKKIGFESFTQLDLSDQMIKTPEKAEEFLKQLLEKSQLKLEHEIKDLKSDLPENIELIGENFKPWDILYVKEKYKKKHLDVDESKISEYFPLDNTIKELLSIYEQFLGLEFQKFNCNNLWSEDLECLKVYKNNEFIGFLILDLFPRPGKYTHACHITVIPSIRKKDKLYPGVGLVVANFPKPMSEKPALLKRNDVITFFHEFGHALHSLLGATELASFSGTRVKRDFVEMPSQMLEEWMWNESILKKVSSHFKTQDSLSDELIKKIVALKNFDSGYWVQRQVFYSLLSLNYFKEGSNKDIEKVFKDTFLNTIKYLNFDQNSHDFASFGHLTGYAAKYYGYLWSKVFAIDLFKHIETFGLLNQEAGEKYIDSILSKGGSVDPNNLLENFLDREPKIQSFFDELGL